MKQEFKIGQKILVEAIVRSSPDQSGDIRLHMSINGARAFGTAYTKPEAIIPAPEYEVGEEVEVSDNETVWLKRWYIGHFCEQVVASSNSAYSMSQTWNHIRKLQKLKKKATISLKLEINGVACSPYQISEETWLKIRTDSATL